MNTRRLIIPIAVLAVAVMATLAVRLLFFPKASEKNNLANNQSEDKGASIIEFKNHKSFLSRKYKFAIEYPYNWYVRKNVENKASEKFQDLEGHEFCFNNVSTRLLANSDSPYCGLYIFITRHATPLSAEGMRNTQTFLLSGVDAIKGISTNEYFEGAPEVRLKIDDWHYTMIPFEREYGPDSIRENLVQSFELTNSSGPAVYKSRMFQSGGFSVVLPKGWVYEENPDDVAIVVFYWEGATASEGIGSKVYLRSTRAKSFEDFQKEIKARDVEQSNITYTMGDIGGFQTVFAKGYPGIADESSVLYAFTGNGWYFEFVDPPFDLNSLKKIIK